MSLEIRKVHLECTTGNSYKEYNIIITQVGTKYDLRSTYGRIGGSKVYRDIKLGVDLADATKEYQKILKAKTRKGYVIEAQEDVSRFTSQFIGILVQRSATLVAEGGLERNHYEGIKKMLGSVDTETLVMAEKIIIANEVKLSKAA